MKETEITNEWKNILNELKGTELFDSFEIYVDIFFESDLIVPKLFLENFEVLRNSIARAEGKGTKSIQDILYLPPLFDSFFVAAYPDVYLWYQDNSQSGKIKANKIFQKLQEDKVEEYFNEWINISKFYIGIIDQYLDEGNSLECSIGL